MSENLSDTNSGQEEVTERNRPPLATLCPWHGFVFTRPRFQLSHPVNRQSLQARTMHSLAVLLLVVGGVVGNAYVIDSRYELPFPKIGTRLTQLRPSRLCLRGGGNEVEIRIRCKETQPGENVGRFYLCPFCRDFQKACTCFWRDRQQFAPKLRCTLLTLPILCSIVWL